MLPGAELATVIWSDCIGKPSAAFGSSFVNLAPPFNFCCGVKCIYWAMLVPRALLVGLVALLAMVELPEGTPDAIL